MMAARAVVKSFQIIILIVFFIVNILEAVQAEGCIKNVSIEGSVMTSPGYPDEYPPKTHCSWIFTTTPYKRIKLVFNFFRLEACSNCGCDYVALYDGNTEDAPKLGQFCGTLSNFSVTSTSQKMLMILHSDHSAQQMGFKVTYKTVFKEEFFVRYFLNTRRQHMHSTNKWGTEITRTAVALFLNDPKFFTDENRIGEEIAYEVTLQLMSKLVMKKRITTKNLALFVNAMTVACINPTNFFGVNIVSELRNRVDNCKITNPFFILTLCNAGEHIKTEDILKLQQLFDAYLRPSWTNTQAMVIMALKCISKQQPHRNLNTILAEMVSKIKRKQKIDGTVDNSKTTALVIQAIIATESNETNFNMSMALSSIGKGMRHAHVGSEEMYYIMPILKRKSLLDINSSHCESVIKIDFQMKNDSRKIPDERIQVQISIIIGDDMEFTRTWSIKVSSSFSLYQVLENISSSEPDYLIQFSDLEGKPYVTNVANYEESIEDDLFWFICSKPLSSSDHPILLQKSPVDIPVNEANEFILWYRSGSGVLTQEI